MGLYGFTALPSESYLTDLSFNLFALLLRCKNSYVYNLSKISECQRNNTACPFSPSPNLFIQHCQDNSNCVHHPSLSLSLYLQNLHTSVIFEKGEVADHNLEKDYGMPPTPLRLEEQHRGEHSGVVQVQFGDNMFTTQFTTQVHKQLKQMFHKTTNLQKNIFKT